ncbi:hypothetical protein QN277_006925 [Acacia crassicarpa]|uniref:Late embryogenesis abundant protein LEA-2 subgroup domain-containing protein n=1 Tax=Acacia crassicarpa TaxID=499986 RepID=A0AAE1ITL3_9FABA|nr:hypothetical protein QN277_006925 [Acacia crassicarpa]
MADQVRSRNSSSSHEKYHSTASQEDVVPRNPIHPVPEKPVPPSTEQTYIIQIPRDEAIRFPPSENGRRMEQYVRQENRRRPSCCRLCWLICLLMYGIALGGAVLNLILVLEGPHYTIERISIHGMNLTSRESQAISPEFDIALRAKNLYTIFGIHYQKDSSVKVYYNELRLVDGALPAFYQPSNNVTVFQTSLKGFGVMLTSTNAKALRDAQNKRIMPLTLMLEAPVKLKVGSVETWKMTVTGNCLITVDSLTAKANVVSKDCDIVINLLG